MYTVHLGNEKTPIVVGLAFFEVSRLNSRNARRRRGRKSVSLPPRIERPQTERSAPCSGSLIPPDGESWRSWLSGRHSVRKQMGADRKINVTVPVEITGFKRCMGRRTGLEGVGNKVSRGCLFQNYDRSHRRRTEALGIHTGWQEGDGDDVDVTVGVEVGGQSPIGSREIGEPMVCEANVSVVLKPIDTVSRVSPGVVKGVSIGAKNVQIAILIEIS